MSDPRRAGDGALAPHALAPCGPGCCFAEPLAGYPDFVWCALHQTPRSTNNDRVDCREFKARAEEGFGKKK